MLRRLGMVALLLLVPAAARAQEAPEQLLPAGTQVYLRWDGIEPHRGAYEKLALGKILQGDTGKFVGGVFTQFQDLLGSVIVQELLQGTAPDKLQKLQDDASKAPKLIELLGEHGFLLAVEVRGLEPPDAQAVLIFPDAGPKAAPLLAAARLGAALTKQEIKDREIEGRTVYQLPGSPLPTAWWVEGKHVVVAVGTNLPSTLIKQFTAKGPRLPDNPLFKKLQAFKEFPHGTRAFVDVEAVAKVAGSRNEQVAKLIGDLGLDGVKSLSFWSGFDGATERGLTELETTGTTKGVLRLLGGKPFRLGDVPPLPPDTAAWTMTNFDGRVAYDETVAAAETVVKTLAPNELPKLKELLKEADDGLGISIRKDLLENLGDQVVQYNSPSEGALFFGQVYLLKVKDAGKLQDALDQAVKGLGKRLGIDATTRKRTYHGVELREVHVRQQGFIFVPTYAVHKGWLAVGFYPQAVQGYLLRANGELPAWKPEESTREALGKLPKEFLSVSVSDPRPGVKQVLALAPLAGGAVNSFVPESKFDVGSVPNAHEVSRHLFPNVTVVTRQGNTVRSETRASLALPVDLANTDTLIALQFLARFAFGTK